MARLALAAVALKSPAEAQEFKMWLLGTALGVRA